MTSPKQKAANRLNAIKSTGPRSTEGTRQASLNAVKHRLSLPVSEQLYGKEIATVMDRMARRFPDAASRFTPGNDIAYERCRFIIPDMIIRRLYPGP